MGARPGVGYDVERGVRGERLPLGWIEALWLNEFECLHSADDDSMFALYVENPFCLGTRCSFCCYDANVVSSAADATARYLRGENSIAP